MRVKVIESFIDKTNDKVRNIDDEFDCSEERYNEIEKAGHYIVKVASKQKGKAKEHGA